MTTRTSALSNLLSQHPEASRRLQRLYERLRQILVDRFETIDERDGAFASALELYVQLAVMRECEEEVWGRLRDLLGSVVGEEDAADEPVVALLREKLREIARQDG
jgi:hypothetical protein